ncbi:glycoside hydrolase superfamily, partial [Tribonema minus]
QVVLVIQLRSHDYRSLQAVGEGRYDKQLNAFIDEWKADGNRRLGIRPMHEFNGDWYEWGTYRGGSNSKAAFKRAYTHVSRLFRKRGANAVMQLSYNCVNPNDDQTSFKEWYPGAEHVDMVLCSAYNRAGIDSDHQKWETFEQVFGWGYKQMAALPGRKRLGVAEMGTTSWGGHSKAQWIRDAFKALVNQYTRVEEGFWLLQNKDGSGDWNLNTRSEVAAFGQSMRKYEYAADGVKGKGGGGGGHGTQ